MDPSLSSYLSSARTPLTPFFLAPSPQIEELLFPDLGRGVVRVLAHATVAVKGLSSAVPILDLDASIMFLLTGE